MVRKNNNLFECESCGLKYKEKEIAEKCEVFCNKYNACSLEIIKHAVQE